MNPAKTRVLVASGDERVLFRALAGNARGRRRLTGRSQRLESVEAGDRVGEPDVCVGRPTQKPGNPLAGPQPDCSC